MQQVSLSVEIHCGETVFAIVQQLNFKQPANGMGGNSYSTAFRSTHYRLNALEAVNVR